MVRKRVLSLTFHLFFKHRLVFWPLSLSTFLYLLYLKINLIKTRSYNSLIIGEFMPPIIFDVLSVLIIIVFPNTFNILRTRIASYISLYSLQWPAQCLEHNSYSIRLYLKKNIIVTISKDHHDSKSKKDWTSLLWDLAYIFMLVCTNLGVEVENSVECYCKVYI